MNQAKQEIIEKRRVLRKENGRYRPWVFERIPATLWPRMLEANRIAVLRDSQFLVQVFQEGNGVIRLSVNRTAIDDGGIWRDGITWDELQRIKRECGYGDRDGVEAYPKDGDVVNVANLRHVWIVPEGYAGFFWRLKV